ncbi:MAG: 50S ribosomal protein L11 methyltransferase [Verrucomicrobiota bacterium]
MSIVTTREADEAVGELLARHFATIASTYTDEETKISTVSVYLNGAAKWSAAVKRRLAAELQLIRECGLDIGAGRIECRKVRRENWAESWKRHFQPLEIGPTLLIKPSWSRRKPKKGQAVVVLDPGLSFGTGQHATTSFCLKQLVDARQAGERQAFLDIGTGSGILAIAAAKLGYSPVKAFDFDPEAVRVAKENAAANGVARRISLQRQDLTKLPVRSAAKYDVVCANLIFDLLVAEVRRITNRLQPRGTLVLSGILTSQFGRVSKAYKGAGFRLVAERTEGEWHSGAFQRANR